MALGGQATYRAWGHAQEVIARASQAAGVTPRNPLRFQGQQFDEETGLHYNRLRYYDPQLGRLISEDPIALQGGINKYQYAPNPVTYIDPLGLAKGKCVICWYNHIGGATRHSRSLRNASAAEFASADDSSPMNWCGYRWIDPNAATSYG
ncbi:TPA: RHS repeat-associated core domain-containing protein [Burkholderia vietnamiensis]|nr:RHS repeat-associated core domain-containing protein [Burkholderia vietnamiensis]HDR9201852.1 RHS repeat-associated core domain-containing protein [Burkholderia vietnamiensis]HDR9359296.1 RHS repeat-associated core domain-containing protein [Burkholderia vietnamiensis]